MGYGAYYLGTKLYHAIMRASGSESYKRKIELEKLRKGDPFNLGNSNPFGNLGNMSAAPFVVGAAMNLAKGAMGQVTQQEVDTMGFFTFGQGHITFYMLAQI